MERTFKKKSEVLAEEISKLPYGEIVYHSAISSIIGEKYGTQQYRQVVQAAKKILLVRYGVLIESIRKSGYRVVEPDNYVDNSLKHYKRGYKQFKQGSTVLTNAPTKDMTPEGLVEYRRVNDRAVTLQASLTGAVVELKALAKKEHPFLREIRKG